MVYFRQSFLVLALFAAACSPGADRQPAPEFSLRDVHGTSYALDDYRGKVVILNFWAPWCFNCEAEMAAFEELRAYFPSDKFEVLAVTVLDEGKSIEKVKYSYPVLLDREKVVAEKYEVGLLPVTLVLDKWGCIVEFPDPDSGKPTAVIQGPRGWNTLKVVRELERLIDE